MASLFDVACALERYHGLDGADVAPIRGGLVNETYAVRVGNRSFVLQRVSSIFDPAIHHNIHAVTRRLVAAGMTTPLLVETKDGRLWAELGDVGTWRLMTFVDGCTYDRVQSPAQAAAASRLVASFHSAVATLDHTFVGARIGVHDTAKHLRALKLAGRQCLAHRLHAEVIRLASAIMVAATRLPPLPTLPMRICHGDLKISNVLFDEGAPGDEPVARCLIDLDTLGPMALAHELGDAWRSWCNPATEDEPEATTFDLEIFEAAWRGYADAVARPLNGDERRALLYGVDWISLELAARFATDALREQYFGWDRCRYPGAGEHNLARARGQWALHRAVAATREQRAAILGVQAS